MEEKYPESDARTSRRASKSHDVEGMHSSSTETVVEDSTPDGGLKAWATVFGAYVYSFWWIEACSKSFSEIDGSCTSLHWGAWRSLSFRKVSLIAIAVFSSYLYSFGVYQGIVCMLFSVSSGATDVTHSLQISIHEYIFPNTPQVVLRTNILQLSTYKFGYLT